MTYPIQNASDALRWYETQAEFYGPMTDYLLSSAGIHPGMTVLDVGSGAGDLSIVLARLVGPSGRVVGVDQSNDAVLASKERLRSLGLTNVEFIHEDATQITWTDCFDAVVGRFVLMYFGMRAPSVLRELVKCAKSGGPVAFIEPDYSGMRSSEELPFCSQISKFIVTVLDQSGVDTRMGLNLFRVFIEAGLGRPTLTLASAIGGGPQFAGYEVAAGFLAVIRPMVQKLGLATPSDLSDVEAKMRKEVSESGGVVVFPPLVAACARRGRVAPC